MKHPVTGKGLPAYMSIRRWNAFSGMSATDTYEAIVFGQLISPDWSDWSTHRRVRPQRKRVHQPGTAGGI